MKKIVALLCALVMAMPCVMLTGCGSREEQLKMYVPGEYVDEDIFDGFKEFYKEKTGKSVDVVVTVDEESAAFYWDRPEQLLYDSVKFPMTVPNARDNFDSISFDDLNGDGETDLLLKVDKE